MLKRFWLSAALVFGTASVAPAQTTPPVMSVLKQVSCGCCGGWVARMQAAGFTVEVRNVTGEALQSAKVDAGLPQAVWACHTASVAGYTVEGHVPAGDILRLLAERPDAVGIAAPGMPMGSPGMEYGDERDAYDVVLVAGDGGLTVFASYPGN